MQFNKIKVEKEAKAHEIEIKASNLTENRSVIRAVARFQAAANLYPEATEEARNLEIYTNFYADAKWQPAWEEPFAKSSASSLGVMLKDKCGEPAVRGKRTSTAPQPVQEPDSANPEATLMPAEVATTA